MATRPRRTAAAAAPAADALERYRAKRDFGRTPEPAAVAPPPSRGRTTGRAALPSAAATDPTPSFVIQKHWASRLHYDFRLELDGVLLSWAVPKGPSFDPAEKRIAIRVEDHPLDYGGFEGTIPPKQYGAGRVIVWDRGGWTPVGDPRAGLAAGKLVFDLHGEKLAGRWELVRIAKPGERQDPWILFKKRDAWARPLADYDVIAALPDSVMTSPLGPVEQREPQRSTAAGTAARGSAGGQGAADGAAATDIAPGPAALPRRAADLPGAVQAPLPETLQPQLATAASRVPTGGHWLCEIKFDGYRLLARVDGRQVRLHTRKGHDWTERLPGLAAALGTMKLGRVWLDGEIVVLDAEGRPDFGALQNAIDARGDAGIEYFVFDLPHADSHDLTAVPLSGRRALLQRLVDERASAPVRFSTAFDADPASVLASASALGLEGIVAKRADAPYVPRRATSWLKLKAAERQEFVVAGYVARDDVPAEVGSLMLAYHGEDGRLVYAGNVGTGWDAKTARALREELGQSEIPRPPFAAGAPRAGRWTQRPAAAERWVDPRLVVEVRFGGWTTDGHVRHAVFVGRRLDKAAHEVRREPTRFEPARAQDPGEGQPRATAGRAGAEDPPSRRRAAVAPAAPLLITHAERVIDPSTGLTKRDLVRYYESVAERLLPHLRGRPVSLVRGPDGVGGPLFFQKHLAPLVIPGVRELDPALWPGHAAMVEIASAEALLQAAQMNVIELHTWNSTVRHIGHPDRIVFDLDPGEGVAWPRVQEAALLTRTLLDELGLASWLKTSGGKGLHVVVPIAPRLPAEAVKALSRAVVQHLAATIPSRFVAKSGAANRVGRVFVDWLRNGHAATTATAFSARARPGLGVSMPVDWSQLDELKSGAQWTIATAREHLSFERADPWAGYWRQRQGLRKSIQALGIEP